MTTTTTTTTTYLADAAYDDDDDDDGRFFFREHLERAVASVRRVLDLERAATVRPAGEIDHVYEDKYELADAMVNSGIVALLAVLGRLGLTPEVLEAMACNDGDDETKKSSDAILRFEASKKTSFVREEVVDEPLVPLIKKKTEQKKKDATTNSTKTTERKGEADFIGVMDDETETTTAATTESTTTESTTTIESIVKRVKRRHFDVVVGWELSIYSGTDLSRRSATILLERESRTVSVLDSPSAAASPPPAKRYREELSLAWLLRRIDVRGRRSHFSIDVKDAATKTPYRNPQVGDALSFFREASAWAREIDRIVGELVGVENRARTDDLLRDATDGIFVPVLPFLVERKEKARGGGGGDDAAAAIAETGSSDDDDAWIDARSIDDPDASAFRTGFAVPSRPEEQGSAAAAVVVVVTGESSKKTLSAADTARFLNEQARTLSEVRAALESDFPDPDATNETMSLREAELTVLSRYVGKLNAGFAGSLRYIEAVLERQLIAAIGREVGSSDLGRYMRYHNEKLLDPGPEPFCYSIRRPERHPDGILEIEEVRPSNNGREATTTTMTDHRIAHIATHVRDVSSRDPIEVPLNAATTVSLTGKTFVHGWLNHRFLGEAPPFVRLTARARQFSSFVLLVGTMTKRDRFEPKDAIILRNKDRVLIPVLLREIPTATEFRNATSSLSPEQRRFARSFRTMQLGTSVTGVCVVRIKPQLERLLGLPDGALTKEIKLTEDLMELFVDHQIPSDLLSCDVDDDGDDSGGASSAKERVANVREHVASVLGVIDAQKREQLEEQKRKAELSKHVTKQAAAAASAERHHHRHQFQRHQRFGRSLPLATTRALRMPAPSAAHGSSSPMDSESVVMYAGMEEDDIVPVPKGYGSSSPIEFDVMCAEEQDVPTTTTRSNPPPPSSDRRRRGSSSSKGAAAVASASDATTTDDPTALPGILDRVLEERGGDPTTTAVRSTTLEPAGGGWTRSARRTLLSDPVEEDLPRDAVATETARAFDLLDALSRSGSLDIPCSELRVLLCATHAFERTVMDTVLKDGIDPIEELERSTLLMASTVAGRNARDLIRRDGPGPRSSSSSSPEASRPDEGGSVAAAAETPDASASS